MDENVRILRLIAFIARKQQIKISKMMTKYNLTAGEFPIYKNI
jgi:hypothetical protein